MKKSKLVLLTTPTCINCVTVKKYIEENQLNVRVANIMDDKEAFELASKLNVRTAPSLVNLVTNEVVSSLGSVLKYLEEFKDKGE